MIRHCRTARGLHIPTADSTWPESHSASTKTKLKTTRKQNKMGEYKEIKRKGHTRKLNKMEQYKEINKMEHHKYSGFGGLGVACCL